MFNRRWQVEELKGSTDLDLAMRWVPIGPRFRTKWGAMRYAKRRHGPLRRTRIVAWLRGVRTWTED